jgi:parallel beta-helix repeat protein
MNVRQFSLILPCFALLLPASAGLLGGCGDSATDGVGGGGGGGSVPASCEGVDVSACDVVIGPVDGDDTTTLQGAIIEDVKSGDTLCLCPGTYDINNEVGISTPGVTIRGVGAGRDDVVLDFAGQLGGDNGVNATGDDFTVENLSIKNSPGDGIVATGVDGVTFRNLHVYWDAGSDGDNGAYAVYPVQSTNVLIEDCEIVGASDAGAYVGQSTNIIVRNNLVHGNVAGIEIENSTDAEVYGNEAYDNAAGILVFALPNLDKTDSLRCDVHDNLIYENNHDNFGDPDTTVGAVPPGIGVLILAADETHIHDNEIRDNKTGGIVIVGHETLNLLVQNFMFDPDTDPDPEITYIYGNTFDNVGYDPADPISAINDTIEQVLWDGIEKTAGSAELCLSMSPPTFRNINGLANLAMPENHSTDTTPFECDIAPLPPIEL